MRTTLTVKIWLPFVGWQPLPVRFRVFIGDPDRA